MPAKGRPAKGVARPKGDCIRHTPQPFELPSRLWAHRCARPFRTHICLVAKGRRTVTLLAKPATLFFGVRKTAQRGLPCSSLARMAHLAQRAAKHQGRSIPHLEAPELERFQASLGPKLGKLCPPCVDSIAPQASPAVTGNAGVAGRTPGLRSASGLRSPSLRGGARGALALGWVG